MNRMKETPMIERRYELDWLRVLAILVVFLFHSTRFFNLGDWHIKNADTYVWVEIFQVVVTRWMMPLFFFISGASLFYAMGRGNGFRTFYAGKFQRLMIPVLVAVLTHSAVQVYLDRVSHNRFSGSFFSFLPEYFNGLYLEIGAPGNFPFHGLHLWYLLFLFVYSLLCYGLFRWLKRGGARLLDRVTKIMAVPGLIYLWLVLPLVIIRILVPHTVLSVGQGGWGFMYYIWFLVAGFIMASSEELRQCLKNQRVTSLVLGGVFMLAYLFQVFSRSRLTFPEPVSDWGLALLNYLSAWCLLAAILGFGLRYLAFDNHWVRRANEGVLPFYIMHQSVLVIIGFWLVTWNIPDLFKWMIIFALSFFILVSLYWFCIRQYDLLRFLFGLKTGSPLYARLSGRWALAGFLALYLGLFSLGLITQILGPTANLKAMPLQFDSQKDVELNCESITRQSGSGVRVVQDTAASAGRAMEFSSGATQRIEPEPEVFVDLTFEAPAGTYVVWLRGKAESEDILTDSVRLQWDHYLGTGKGIASLGNWIDLHPAGSYAWASNGAFPASMVLKHNGRHRIRLQPRQTPHRIDQIWLSRFQWAVPETAEPLPAKTGFTRNQIENKEDIEPPARGLAQGAKIAK